MDDVHPFADGISARVRSTGDIGILWIHGYTIDSSIWEEIWSLLPGWSHYGIDLPGHGASPPLTRGKRLREFGQQLADAAIEHNVRHIVGLSLGSMIALEVAVGRPQAFSTLTLAAPTIAGGPNDGDVGLRYKELFETYQRRGPGPWMTELWMRCPPETFAYASPELRSKLAAIIDCHSWSELREPELGISALARQPQDAQGLLFSTAHPFFIIGEHELPAFRETAEILRRIRTDARFVELPGAGHLCILHCPHEAARLLAEEWLTSR
jgi:2-succinyl-6-hydroxy-2,4-cyclohexadiene-1-carboxylate synthase